MLVNTNAAASSRLHWLTSAIIALTLVVFDPFLLGAPKKPTTVWPDPSTGLMWAGLVYGGGLGDGRDFTQAQNDCASLNLAGLSEWRLPTDKEVLTVTTIVTGPGSGTYISHRGDTHDSLVLQHGIKLEGQGLGLWTSTIVDNKKIMVLLLKRPMDSRNLNSAFDVSSPNSSIGKGALCTRTMEPDLLQIATDAQIDQAVPDLLTLKASALVGKAKLAYRARQFPEVVAQGQAALQIEPQFAPAYQVIGIGYGMLGQWDLAVSNLETAAKLDKSYKSALQWAKAGQSAAKKGQQIDAISLLWKD